MGINWKKAEGKTPEGQVLAISKDGSLLIGYLSKEKNIMGWTCGRPSFDDFNEYLHNVSWYLMIDDLLATVPGRDV